MPHRYKIKRFPLKAKNSKIEATSNTKTTYTFITFDSNDTIEIIAPSSGYFTVIKLKSPFENKEVLAVYFELNPNHLIEKVGDKHLPLLRKLVFFIDFVQDITTQSGITNLSEDIVYQYFGTIITKDVDNIQFRYKKDNKIRTYEKIYDPDNPDTPNLYKKDAIEFANKFLGTSSDESNLNNLLLPIKRGQTIYTSNSNTIHMLGGDFPPNIFNNGETSKHYYFNLQQYFQRLTDFGYFKHDENKLPYRKKVKGLAEKSLENKIDIYLGDPELNMKRDEPYFYQNGILKGGIQNINLHIKLIPFDDRKPFEQQLSIKETILKFRADYKKNNLKNIQIDLTYINHLFYPLDRVRFKTINSLESIPIVINKKNIMISLSGYTLPIIEGDNLQRIQLFSDSKNYINRYCEIRIKVSYINLLINLKTLLQDFIKHSNYYRKKINDALLEKVNIYEVDTGFVRRLDISPTIKNFNYLSIMQYYRYISHLDKKLSWSSSTNTADPLMRDKGPYRYLNNLFSENGSFKEEQRKYKQMLNEIVSIVNSDDFINELTVIETLDENDDVSLEKLKLLIQLYFEVLDIASKNHSTEFITRKFSKLFFIDDKLKTDSPKKLSWSWYHKYIYKKLFLKGGEKWIKKSVDSFSILYKNLIKGISKGEIKYDSKILNDSLSIFNISHVRKDGEIIFTVHQTDSLVSKFSGRLLASLKLINSTYYFADYLYKFIKDPKGSTLYNVIVKTAKISNEILAISGRKYGYTATYKAGAKSIKIPLPPILELLDIGIEYNKLVEMEEDGQHLAANHQRNLIMFSTIASIGLGLQATGTAEGATGFLAPLGIPTFVLGTILVMAASIKVSDSTFDNIQLEVSKSIFGSNPKYYKIYDKEDKKLFDYIYSNLPSQYSALLSEVFPIEHLVISFRGLVGREYFKQYKFTSGKMTMNFKSKIFSPINSKESELFLLKITPTLPYIGYNGGISIAFLTSGQIEKRFHIEPLNNISNGLNGKNYFDSYGTNLISNYLKNDGIIIFLHPSIKGGKNPNENITFGFTKKFDISKYTHVRIALNYAKLRKTVHEFEKKEAFVIKKVVEL